MATSSSTIYPKLQAADPSRPSLADFPLEIVLQIIEASFEPEQIIVIDVLGKRKKKNHYSLSSVSRPKVILHAPPLHKQSAACRLFRHMYRRSRPTLWGAHLSRGRAYNVDMARDIFYVRMRYSDMLNLFPRDEDLAGLNKMAIQFITTETLDFQVSHRMKLNPRCKDLLFFTPVPNLEWGTLNLAPALLAMGDNYEIKDPKNPSSTWGAYKEAVSFHMRLRSPRFPLPEIKGFMVDERRLGGPNDLGRYPGI
jgi:hypothetical protein